MVTSILTVAGRFREVKNLTLIGNDLTAEAVYSFEGCFENEQSKKWEVPIQHVIARSYASEKSNVSPTNGQLEYFVFGKCQGLALDGSLGLGEYRDRKSFDEYVAWYNNTKLTNSKWLSMKVDGDIYKAPKFDDLPF
jgi:hypothetical protein